MSIDKVVLVDDRPNEITPIIHEFNRKGIATLYYEDPDELLSDSAKIPLGTQLIILDLFLGEADEGISKARDMVLYFSEKIRNPYIIVVFSKNHTRFPEMIENIEADMRNEEFSEYNFPVNIIQISSELADGKGEATYEGEKILSDVNNELNSNTNIKFLFELNQIYNKAFHEIWLNVFNKEKFESIEERKSGINARIFRIISDFDKVYQYSGSLTGLGTLHLILKYSEQILLENPIENDLDIVESTLEEHDKLILNGLLLSHPTEFLKKNEKIKNISGLIWYDNQISLDLDEYRQPDSPGRIDYIVAPQGISSTLRKAAFGRQLVKILERKDEFIKPAFLNITPYCDIAREGHEKVKNYIVVEGYVFNLRAFRMVIEETLEENYHTDFTANALLPNEKNKKNYGFIVFKNEINLQIIDEPKFFVYKSKSIKTVDLESNRDIEEHCCVERYLIKEIVNDIQHKVSAEISRVGISLLD